MTQRKVLVTGASGFIGQNLVPKLIAQGDTVFCLVRTNSTLTELKKFDCQFLSPDLSDATQLESTLKPHDFDLVYHLAAKTKALSLDEMMGVNVGGWKNLLAAFRNRSSPPTVVMVSSLAAAGPSDGRPHVETDSSHPVSNYGKSKLQAEQAAREFADEIPISIVRPPIVLGPYDREGLALFKSIASAGIHLIPGFSDDYFSLIHVNDLVHALIKVAADGQRLDASKPATGLYYAAGDETITYRELGRLIGQAVDRERVRMVRCPDFALWTIATLNSIWGQVRRKPQYLDRDKAREATAGSWTCSNAKISRQLGFAPAFPIAERLQQIAQWYWTHDWLVPKSNHDRSAQQSVNGPIGITGGEQGWHYNSEGRQ